MKDLTDLRKIAEQATQGNWMWVNDREDERIRAGKFPYEHVIYTSSAEDEDSLHIATFDPPTVLELLNRVERAEAKLVTQTRVLKTIAKRNVGLAADRAKMVWNLEQAERERDEWRGKYDEAETASTDYDATIQRVREALTEVQGRGEWISAKEGNGSIRSAERAARGVGYLEATRLAFKALDGEPNE